jgi:hypothetical protein
MFEMKKTLGRIAILLIFICTLMSIMTTNRHEFDVISCVTCIPVKVNITEKNQLETEDITMHLVYQLARRNIVKVTTKDAAGSGIIWKIGDSVIIVSNKHLLMRDVKANVAFCNGETVDADVIGYSQQYDIGFLKVSGDLITVRILRDIYEAVPVIYESSSPDDIEPFNEKYVAKRIMQVGVDYDNQIVDYSVGNIGELRFEPLFNTNIVVTNCTAKAGMSGGGLFDSEGRLLGMISGGDVPEGAERKESAITYSIPAGLIQEEFEQLSY